MQPALPEPGKNNIWYLDRHTEDVIVFVHGIFSDSRSCWYRAKPPSYWPQLLSEDDRFKTYSIFLGGYYTAIDAGPYDVSNCADELFSALGRTIDNSQSVLARKRIIFVCHSTGGIVARYMLETRAPTFAPMHVGLLLIASPSYGSKWATRLGLLSRFYNQQLGARLEWGNWSLQDLDDRFRRLLAERRLPYLIGLEAYENHFIIHRRWLPDRSYLVPKESAGKYFGPPVLLRNTDHFTSVKPDSRDHPAYELLSDFASKFEREQHEAVQPIEGGAVTAQPESPVPQTAAESATPTGFLARFKRPKTEAQALDVTAMIAAEEHAERQRRWRVFGIVLALFAVSLSLGYYDGGIYSIDFTKPDSAAYYLATHGQWRSIDRARGELFLRAGVRMYRYRTGDARPTVAYLPPDYIAAHPMPKRAAVDDEAKFAALTVPVLATDTGVWIAVFNKGTALSQTETRFLIALGVATGGYLGFLLGSQDKGTVDSPAFQQGLATNGKLWSSFEDSLRKDCSLIRDEKLIEESDSVLAEIRSAHVKDSKGLDPEAHNGPDRASEKKRAALKQFTEGLLSTRPDMTACATQQ